MTTNQATKERIVAKNQSTTTSGNFCCFIRGILQGQTFQQRLITILPISLSKQQQEVVPSLGVVVCNIVKGPDDQFCFHWAAPIRIRSLPNPPPLQAQQHWEDNWRKSHKNRIIPGYHCHGHRQSWHDPCPTRRPLLAGRERGDYHVLTQSG